MCSSIKLKYILSFALTMLLVTVCGSLSAITVPQTTEQLVENSSDVIRGNVISQKSQWDESHSTIYTEIEIEVSEVVIGSIEEGRTVTVFVPGGQVGDTGLAVEHAAEFKDGEDVVLFLTVAQGRYGVTSWELGKFSVESGNIKSKNISVTEFIEEIKAVKR